MCVGVVVYVKIFVEVMNEIFKILIVLVCDYVGGGEEIFFGVIVVFTGFFVDVLSYSVVRVRNGGVLFVICYDLIFLDKFFGMNKKVVKLYVIVDECVVFDEIVFENIGKENSVDGVSYNGDA